MSNLNEKVERAVRLIRSGAAGKVIEVCYSGGKDSEVILELVRESGVHYRAIYRNTTVDYPGTISHVIERGAEVHRVPKTFFQLIRQKGMPTRRCRFCCEKMKEYKILDVSVQGIRRAESVARAKRYSSDDPIVCRLYGRSRNQHVSIILPILDWTNQDVEEFIKERGIKCHSLYYDSDGNFKVKARLGCFTCPLQGDNGLSDFRENPRFVRAYILHLRAWWNEHPNTKCHTKFQDECELFIHNVFSRTYEKHKEFIAKNIPDGNYLQWLEREFNISLQYLPELRPPHKQS